MQNQEVFRRAIEKIQASELREPERLWVRSVKQECLSKLILFGAGPLSRALAEFSAHYHGERNHQGKGNMLLFPNPGDGSERPGPTVQCRQRLGGLLKYYARAA